jgi:hypothetical protein
VATYEQWAQAIGNVLFPETNAGRPVYLDFEEDVLRKVAQAAAVEGDPVADLATAVRGSLDLSRGSTDPFRQQVINLESWRRKTRRRASREHAAEPPCLPLLALLSIAAERMGEDTNYAANAFYPRVCGLLGIADRATQDRFQRTYMRHAEDLWASLNEWLERLDGARGLPTAYALTFRYIGLALSQALVRRRDRVRFPQLFLELGLVPGAQVAPPDMVSLLGPWIERNPSPVSNSLQDLWAAGAAQERIATVAALELEAWDGTASEGGLGTARHDIRLTANLRKFPAKSLQLSLSISLPGAAHEAVASVTSASGQPPVLEFERAADGWLRPRELSGIDQTSLLTGLLRLQPAESDVVLTRRPRPLVVLRLNELVGGFDETERVQLGEDMLILSSADGGLAQKVEETLREVARPGFTRIDELRGLPEGWIAFANVQVMAVASASLATTLNPLVPLVSSQLSFAGGLKLPGRIRKFSSMLPPEIRAVSQHASRLRITLTELGGEESREDLEWVSESASAVVDLSAANLSDGDYSVRLFEDNARDPKQQRTLRLRSGDTYDALMWESSPRLSYDLATEAGWAVLSASESPDDSASWVEGACAAGDAVAVAPVAVADVPTWTRPAPRSEVAGIAPAVIAQPDPTSCVVTGAHRIQLPPALGGRPARKAATIEGTCTSCGLVKRFPARAPSAWRAARTQTAVPTVDVRGLPPVVDRLGDWDAVMDGLMHTGGGDASYLEKLAAQIDESSLFADAFTRSLLALGHIQVERAADFRPTRWEGSASYIAETVDGTSILVGYWPSTLRECLNDGLRKHGGGLHTSPQRTEGPSIHRIVGLPASALEEILAEIGLDTVGVAFAAARTMIDVLPPLSAVRDSLPSSPIPGASSIERFDLGSSAWVKVVGVNRPGAYRLEASFMRAYIYVSSDGLRDGTCRRGSAQLVKHLAAAEAGAPLLAHDPATSQLFVAIGADLPDLYGRVACLCSGSLPVPVPEARSLVYPGVPVDIAKAIASRMAS